jgi:hypothetical protein
MDDQTSTFDRDDSETVALVVGAGGILGLALGWILDSSLLRLLGLTAVLAGGGLYARWKVGERSKRIEETESSIRSELDELDPIARAQVLKGIAQSEL